MKLDANTMALLYTWGLSGWHHGRVRKVAEASGFDNDTIEAMMKTYVDLGFAKANRGV